MIEPSIIRSFVLVASASILPGCAVVKVDTAHIIEPTDTAATLRLTTNKDLRRYEDSFFAYLVYVNYRPSATVVSSDFDNPPVREEYPFSVYFRDASACDDGGRCWLIDLPASDSVGLSLNDYSYSLQPGDSIELYVGGGTMHGARLKSNVVVVSID